MSQVELQWLGWPWLAAGCALALAVLVWWTARADADRLRGLARFGLPGMRILAVLAILAALAEPVLAWRGVERRPPAVALVLDRSGSMALADPRMAARFQLDEAVALGLVDGRLHPDAPARAARLAAELGAAPDQARLPQIVVQGERLAAELAGDPALAVPLAAVVQALRQGSAPAPSLLTDLRTRAAHAQDAADAALLAGIGSDSELARALARLATLPRRERALLLARRLAERLPQARIDWFVLDDRLLPVSGAEGAQAALGGSAATDLGEGLAALARGWSGGGNPAAVVLLSDGRRTAGADPEPAARALAARGVRLVAVALGDPDPPADAACIRLDGPPEAFPGEALRLAATVRLPESGRWKLVLSCDGAEIESRPLAGSGTRSERFTVPASGSGLAVWRCAVVATDGVPDPVPGNDVATLAVAVVDDPLRVLVLDAGPRWEPRHLAAAFAADRRIAVERRFRLLLPPGTPLLGSGLECVDAVVLGDLTPAELGSDGPGRLATWVHGGGCLIALAGPRALPTAWALGPLAEDLPVRAGAAPGGEAGERGVVPGPDGAHALAAVLPDALAWERLPPLPWWARGVTARPGSEVVLTMADAARTPLVVAGRAGAGRVVYVGSDGLWRWRAADAAVHDGFWLGALRWGLGVRLRGADPRLAAALDRPVAVPGERIELRARVARGQPRFALIPAMGAGRSLVAQPVAGQEGLWSATANAADDPLAIGRWRAEITDAGGLVEQRDLLVRARMDPEAADAARDLPGLVGLAAAGGGQAVEPAAALVAVEALGERLRSREAPVQHTFSPWTGLGWPALVAAILFLGWAWRRRVGLP